MSEEQMNRDRVTSMEEPGDERMAQIMSEATEDFSCARACGREALRTGLFTSGLFALANGIAIAVIVLLDRLLGTEDDIAFNLFSLSIFGICLVISFSAGYCFPYILSKDIERFKYLVNIEHAKFVREICKLTLLEKYGWGSFALFSFLTIFTFVFREEYPVTTIIVWVWTLVSLLICKICKRRIKNLRRDNLQRMYEEIR